MGKCFFFRGHTQRLSGVTASSHTDVTPGKFRGPYEMLRIKRGSATCNQTPNWLCYHSSFYMYIYIAFEYAVKFHESVKIKYKDKTAWPYHILMKESQSKTLGTEKEKDKDN